MNESVIKKSIIAYLSNLRKNLFQLTPPVHLWFFKSADTLTSGIPDILGLYEGKFFAMEIKRPGLSATPIQSVVIEKIKQAGGETAVVHSLNEACLFMMKVVQQ